jgi:membrane fusion protein, multidrug efflux system
VDTLHDAVAVPQPAVQNGSSGAFVYLLSADNVVNVHPVQLGPQDGDLIAVAGGLAAGDRVVTDGTDQLRDNARVVVRDLLHAHAGQHRRAGSGPAPQGSDGAAQ